MPKSSSLVSDAKGTALITILLILTILLVLGLSLLGFLKNNYCTLRKISYSIKAYYLAQAGLKYYQVCGLPQNKNVSSRLELPLGNVQQIFTITQINSSTIQCAGKVKNNSGKIIAQCIIVYDLLQNRWYIK